MSTFIAVHEADKGFPTRSDAQKWIDNRIDMGAEYRVCAMDELGPEPCLKNPEQLTGFLAAVDMIRDTEDRYGIGNMCSQWTAAEIANDLLERVGVSNPPKLPVKEPALMEPEAYIIGKRI